MEINVHKTFVDKAIQLQADNVAGKKFMTIDNCNNASLLCDISFKR